MKTFCTIITSSYLPYARALLESLKKYDESISLNVLVVDGSIDDTDDTERLSIHCLDAVVDGSVIGRQICIKYNEPGLIDQLRWSLKPVFINHLLDQGYEKVIFTDPDTFYFSDYTFLFTELDESDILLTPHWRGLNPNIDRTNFELQFVGGLFNAGFIGVNPNSRSAMDWWASCCLYRCEKDFSTGHFVDQAYLNFLPVYFENVKILKHKGCNVANWNQVECKREWVSGEVLINRKWKVVFVHFTRSTINGIIRGDDLLLKPHLSAYLVALEQWGLSSTFSENAPGREGDEKQSTRSSLKKSLARKIRALKARSST